MTTTSLITKHYAGIAAIWLQAASAIWSGFMVKFSPGNGLVDRMVEVRG